MLCVSRLCRLAGAALVLSLSMSVIVEAASPLAGEIKSRQDKLRDMGGALKAIDDELKKGSPDWDNVILPNVDTLQGRSGFLLNWFPKGSGPESGVKTYALPAIWQKSDDFTKLGKAMQAEVAKFKQVSAARNAGGLKEESVALGKSCKACHDNYRSPDYEKENDD
jgi:cytochrome c556